MAKDSRSIVITLKLDNTTNETDTSNQTDGAKVSGESDNDRTSKAVAAFAAAQIMQVVTGEVINWAEYYWNRELTLTDDYIGQRQKQIATTQIARGASAVGTIAGSALAGFDLGGWVGAIIGAVIGASAEVAQTVRSDLQGTDQQNIQLRQMDAQLGFTRSRAGWSTKAASIGEDL